MKVQGLKGTRDYYPRVRRVQNYIFDSWKRVAARFGFEEFEGPLLEPIELWTMKSGEEIMEQLYAFEDKGGRKITVRPDLTPTLARMVALKQKELVKPIKWFSIGRFWRYERPQSGRLREFYQLNMDCLGSVSMKADAEVISTAVEIMRSFGLTKHDFFIRLGNRRLIQNLILNIVQDESLLQDVARLIDKKEKLKEGDFALSLKSLGLDENQIAELNSMLAIDDLAKIDVGVLSEIGKRGFSEIEELFSLLQSYGLEEFVEIDLSIMRGFDYYTSTVFEVFDRTRKFRALAGGGRYDNLVEQFGGESCPGIGYGMGDVVLEMYLRELGKLPELRQDVDYYVLSASDDVYDKALEVARELRKRYNVVIDVSGISFKKQMNYANKISARNVVIVGDKELEGGVVKVKNMVTGAEKEVRLDEVLSF